MNIIWLVSMFKELSVTTMLVVRAVGVFLVPLGAVLGYF